jgi:hypothetical protein
MPAVDTSTIIKLTNETAEVTAALLRRFEEQGLPLEGGPSQIRTAILFGVGMDRAGGGMSNITFLCIAQFQPRG